MKILRVLRTARNICLYPSYNHGNWTHSDNVAVFPALGLVYNRIKKSGNTTITAFLSELSGETFTSARQLKKSMCSPCQMSTYEILQFRGYYSFTFVRNPYSRVLSAYLQKLSRGTHQAFSKYPGFGVDSREGFDTFIRYLEDGGLYGNRHWWPQCDLLYKPPEDFSFIGKLENLSADMAAVLEAVGVDPSAASVLERPHAVSRHTTNASEKEDFYYGDDARTIVKRLYRKDFEVFGYEM